MGRPRKPIDQQKVIDLASIGCTVEEIAAMLDVSKDTLERRFADTVDLGRRKRNASLRRKQFEKAMKGSGDTGMLIWLGKQCLGQRDKSENEVSGKGGAPLNPPVFNISFVKPDGTTA
jgi:hypothetical protein